MSHDPVQAALDEIRFTLLQMRDKLDTMDRRMLDAKREALHQRTRTLPSPQGLTIGPLQPYGTPGTVASGTTVTATTAASRAHAHDTHDGWCAQCAPLTCEQRAVSDLCRMTCATPATCDLAGCQAPQDNEP